VGVRAGPGGHEAWLRGVAAGHRREGPVVREAAAVDLTSGEQRRRRAARLNVQVPYELGILLDELAPRLHRVTHQRLEQPRRFHRVFHRDLEERALDRKSTRLNSSHVAISYAVFC